MAPPPMVNAIWLNSVDTNQGQSAGMWTTQDQAALVTTPYDGLISASQALSDMGVFAAMFQRRKNLANTPVIGAYSTWRDQAVFLVQSPNGVAQLVIPGPKASIFAGDGSTVKLGDPLVKAWWEEVQAVLGDSTGAPWTSLIRGYRTMLQPGIPAGL